MKKLIDSVRKSYTSLYQINYSNLKNQVTKWHNELPNIKPYYAVKSLPLENILKHLASSNVNFDCASRGEIQSVLKFSNPQNIIYANPSKSLYDITYSNNNNVNLMVVDSEEEIKKMDSIDPKIKKVIRIKAVELNSDIKFNSKFGATDEEVFKMLSLLKKNNTFEGFSFHVGSKCKNEESYYLTIKNILDNYQNYCIKNNVPIKMIDIGGGFSSHTNLTILDKILTPFYKNFKDNNIKLIAEPGRYFAEKTHILVLNIIGKKIIKNEDNEKIIIYYLNDGIYGSFNCIYFDHSKPTISPFNERDGVQYKSCLFGPTCDSIDLIADNIMLPELAIGEWVYVENFGAYTIAASSNFNGFKTSICKYIFRS